MKHLSFSPRRRRSRGVAIVTSLLMLAVLCTLAVAILTATVIERQSADGTMAQVKTRQLAQTAINLAIAQIREATSAQLPSGVSAPWTSQPGAIRSHDANGDLEKLYKLYSASEMIVEHVGGLASDVPSDWNERPADFVDLNAPEVHHTSLGEAILQFPILDPRARGASEADSVEGFDYSAEGISGVVEASEGQAPTEQRLPMPVRWLYTLEDGTLGHLDENGKFLPADRKTFPSRTNPIVGRFAFWTDDETSKINVNTASEGVFWDSPRADSIEERALGNFQPASGEYQRFPGHPAMVSLSSVLLPGHRFEAHGSRSQAAYDGDRMQRMDQQDLVSLWELSPLINPYAKVSSMGGTQIPADLLQQGVNEQAPRIRRLSSVQDMYWNAASRETQPFFQRHPAATDRLAQSAFFLTTRSAAPEVTLYGTPRVSMWPVHGSLDPATGDLLSHVNKVTDYDRKAAMASYLGGNKYYVTRQQAWNGAADFSYFRNGERENQALFQYLQRLTNDPVPGFGGKGSFGEKYGAGPDEDRDNILLSMMDYIRLGNLNDGLLDASLQFCVVCAGNEHVGYGQVTGLTNSDTVAEGQSSVDKLAMPKGMGRVLTASEIGFIFTCRAEVLPDGTIKGSPSARNRDQLKEPGDRELEVAILIEGFVPAHGWGEYRPYASVSVGGIPTDELADPDPRALPEMEVCGVPLEVDRQARTAKTGNDLPADWLAWGGSTGVRVFTDRIIQFDAIVVSGEHEELTFSGSVSNGQTLALALFDTPDSAETTRGSGDLIQTIAIPAPPIEGGRIAMPRVPESGMAHTLRDRWRNAIEGSPLISANDVVQTLVPNHGDYRLIAGKRFVGGGEHAAFVAHPDWGRQALAHAFVEPSTHAAMALESAPNVRESYIPGVASDRNSPDYPIRPWDSRQIQALAGEGFVDRSVSGVFGWDRLDEGRRGSVYPHITGDFDNGVGFAPNGPYINRPDDGETRGYREGGHAYFTLSSPEGHRLPSVNRQTFAPHRMVPSPVMFGSLPTGVQANVPWQTLLFRPQENHYGWSGPRDHLLLDLFWMPVAEPTPMSRPFQTEGKINMNHALVPFHYIERKTALHALLKAEKLMAIPDEMEEKMTTFRRFLDAKETLGIWDEEVFEKGNVFLSPSQICEMPLVPEGEKGSREAMNAFWAKHRLTGDNTKERPYAHLYPKLTTRSNTFRVHYVAQALRKARDTDPGSFIDGKDRVLGETRGDQVIERAIDPEHPGLPDYRNDPEAPSLEEFYRYRLSSAQ